MRRSQGAKIASPHTQFPLHKNMYGIEHKAVGLYRILLLPMHEPDFDKVARQLEETLSQLKGAKDPEQRKSLLRTMRRLLIEADRINIKQES